jgi:4-hydroxybenzoate polyprenyltransferase
LIRFDVLMAGVSHIWLMMFLAHGAIEPAERTNPALTALGLPLSLLMGALIGIGLGGCGIALNDALDARHDRAFAPDRPIPSGRVSQRAALAIALGSLLLAIIAALPMGTASMLMTLLALGAIVFYNFTGRFMPAVGIVTLGLVQGLVLAIPNPMFGFGWPVALAMTHVMGCEAGRHHVAGKRPALSGRRATWLMVGWMFWTLAVLGLMSLRGTLTTAPDPGPTPALWLGPVAAVLVFLLLLRRMMDKHVAAGSARRTLADAISRLGFLWLGVYDAVWLLAAGQVLASVVIGLLVVGAWLLIRGQRWLGVVMVNPSGYRVRPRPAEPAERRGVDR